MRRPVHIFIIFCIGQFFTPHILNKEIDNHTRSLTLSHRACTRHQPTPTHAPHPNKRPPPLATVAAVGGARPGHGCGAGRRVRDVGARLRMPVGLGAPARRVTSTCGHKRTAQTGSVRACGKGAIILTGTDTTCVQSGAGEGAPCRDDVDDETALDLKK